MQTERKSTFAIIFEILEYSTNDGRFNERSRIKAGKCKLDLDRDTAISAQM